MSECMPTNKLRRHARELLSLALKAHDDGRAADAHSLTLRAAEFLEDAKSIGEVRGRRRNLPRHENSLIGYGPETLLSWLALAERHVEEAADHLLQQRELLSRLQKQSAANLRWQDCPRTNWTEWHDYRQFTSATVIV